MRTEFNWFKCQFLYTSINLSKTWEWTFVLQYYANNFACKFACQHKVDKIVTTDIFLKKIRTVAKFMVIKWSVIFLIKSVGHHNPPFL